jgi:hypothetical protein
MTTFQDIVNLIAQWKQLVASAPANLQPQIQTMLQRQTPNNPPGANTVQGIIQYYSGHPPFTGQAYIDRDFGTFSQAVADLQNLVTQQAQVTQTAVQPSLNIPTAASISSSAGIPLGPAMPMAAPAVDNSSLYLVGGIGLLLLIALPLLLMRRHPTATTTKLKRKKRKKH